MHPHRVAGQVAANNPDIALHSSHAALQAHLRADAKRVRALRPAHLDLQTDAFAKLIFKELGRLAQIVDHNIQITIIVQVGHTHAASAIG